MSVEAGATTEFRGQTLYAITSDPMLPTGACFGCALLDTAACIETHSATECVSPKYPNNIIWVPVERFVEWRLTQGVIHG